MKLQAEFVQRATAATPFQGTQVSTIGIQIALVNRRQERGQQQPSLPLDAGKAVAEKVHVVGNLRVEAANCNAARVDRSVPGIDAMAPALQQRSLARGDRLSAENEDQVR